jgi:hypothetical protein
MHLVADPTSLQGSPRRRRVPDDDDTWRDGPELASDMEALRGVIAKQVDPKHRELSLVECPIGGSEILKRPHAAHGMQWSVCMARNVGRLTVGRPSSHPFPALLYGDQPLRLVERATRMGSERIR